MGGGDPSQPSIGNLLGFSLVLREHRALLALERRTLAPGVQLCDYEAVVPDVTFPIEGPLSAARFRHRRAPVQRMTLELERFALQTWLDARLLGRVIAGIRVDAVELEPAVRLHDRDAPRAWIAIAGRARAGAMMWLGVSLRLRSDGRALVLAPGHRWLLGREPLDPDRLWLALARALDPRRRAEGLELRIDPAMEALRVPFVRAGWKLPALERLALEQLHLDDRRAKVVWGSGAITFVPAAGDEDADVVPGLCQRVREALAVGDESRACDALDGVLEATAPLPMAHLAALRWGVELAARLPARRLGFLRARLRLRATDRDAQRRIVAGLRARTDHGELERHVRVWEQLAESPRRKLRCALALAYGAIEDGRSDAAERLLAPWRDGEPPTAAADDLGGELARAWAFAALDRPELALQRMADGAAALRSRARAQGFVELGEALAARDHTAAAWRAVGLAIAAASGDGWVPLASSLLPRLDPPDDVARALAHAAFDLGAGPLHRALADAAARAGDRERACRHQWAAVEVAQDHEAVVDALQRWFGFAGVDLHSPAGILAAAARPEVVQACARRLAIEPEHFASLCVLAAQPGDEARSEAIDARILATHGADPRAMPSLLRMAERAHADHDHGRALALCERIDPARLDDDMRRRHAVLVAALDRIDPIARARATLAAVGERDHADAVAMVAQALAREQDGHAASLLLDALERLGAADVAIAELRRRAEASGELATRLELRRRTAELLARAGAVDEAIAELVRARDEAPADVSTWLALLDLCFAEGALPRAVAFVRALLAAVPMGDAAYAAAAGRGVDASLALGDEATALELLDAILARIPGHEGAAARRRDVLATAVDPERRALLLAGIAQRHTGAARVEALDERARVLDEQLGRTDEAIAALEAAWSEAPARGDLAARLGALYERSERWRELATLLRERFGQQRGRERLHSLVQLAEVLRDRVGDPMRAEQALRMAIDLAEAELHDGATADGLRLQLADVLERMGRWTDLAHELQRQLGGEHAALGRERIALLTRLARLQRDVLGDEDAAAATYEALERAGALPDEGLACLAHAYRRARRFDDLVHVLELRARRLQHEPTRWAAVRLRIAELLDGPLARPLDAVAPYLDAFLTDPAQYREVGRRLRVLLVGVVAPDAAVARLSPHVPGLDPLRRAELETLVADVLAHHPDRADEAARRYLDALAADPHAAGAIEGLARLELRRGAVDIALGYVREALQHRALAPALRADIATLAARSLLRRDRDDEALTLLSAALRDAPDHAHALLELARLHERAGRATEQSVVLEHLRTLALPAALRAETLVRHAIALREQWRAEPRGAAAETALGDALGALQSDPTHPGARQVLFELARLRDEWALVVPALEAALRTLGPGPARARVELELAELAADHGDIDGARQRLGHALLEIDDDEVERRATALSLRLPEPHRTAEQLANTPLRARALEPDARARIDRLVARLREAGAAVSSTDDELLAEFERHRQRALAAHGRAAQAPWIAATQVAWHRLGDVERAAACLLEAVGPDCDDDELPPLLGEVALSCSPPLQERIYAALAAIGDARLGPSLRLERASLARLLGRTADALTDLGHLANSGDRDLRRRALAQLDHLLAQVAAPADRIGVLRARLAELAMDDAPELADVAGELAQLEYQGGDVTRALSTCRAGLRVEPQHRALLRLQVELLDHHDLPDESIAALVRYAEVCASPRERARHLVRAARLALDRGATVGAGSQRDAAAAIAADLLARARLADPDDLASRTLALPLAFASGLGAMVDEIAAWLSQHGHGRDPVMVFAALHEVSSRGSTTIATALGRLDPIAVPRLLLPALRQVASELAASGPLARMEAVLDVAATLVGGPLGLFAAVQRWAGDRPLQTGLAWILARLHERHGDPRTARRLQQVAAFLAGNGALGEALPPALGTIEIAEDSISWLDGHAAIRAAVRALAANLPTPSVTLAPQPGWTEDELVFRTTFARTGAVTGLAELLAGDDDEFADRLDALAVLASPAHATTGTRARRFADALAARSVSLAPTVRLALLGELEHWLATPGRVTQLRLELQRLWWLLAVRSCEELRGALRVLAERVGTRSGADLDAAATLRSEPAMALLRALGLYASASTRFAESGSNLPD